MNFFPIVITIVFSMLIAGISYFLKFLKLSGSAATFFLAFVIYGAGGWKWTIPILTFFILSSVLSAAGKEKKKKIELLFEKTDQRDWGQVASNGGVAGIIAILQYLNSNFDYYPVYLGTIAAVTADTWGTEIGVWFQGKTISISRFKIVEPGTNGGISFFGFVGGLIGAAVISTSSLAWISGCSVIVNTIIAGITGSIADSLMGSSIQAIYLCPVCDRNTERNRHCNTSTELIHGYRFVNNDIVNFTCALIGAIVALILMLL